MTKVTAIVSSLMLHVIFIIGFTSTGMTATAIAAERAAHAWTV